MVCPLRLQKTLRRTEYCIVSFPLCLQNTVVCSLLAEDCGVNFALVRTISCVLFSRGRTLRCVPFSLERAIRDITFSLKRTLRGIPFSLERAPRSIYFRLERTLRGTYFSLVRTLRVTLFACENAQRCTLFACDVLLAKMSDGCAVMECGADSASDNFLRVFFSAADRGRPVTGSMT